MQLIVNPTVWFIDRAGIRTRQSISNANSTNKGLAKAEHANKAAAENPEANSVNTGEEGGGVCAESVKGGPECV